MDLKSECNTITEGQVSQGAGRAFQRQIPTASPVSYGDMLLSAEQPTLGRRSESHSECDGAPHSALPPFLSAYVTYVSLILESIEK